MIRRPVERCRGARQSVSCKVCCKKVAPQSGVGSVCLHIWRILTRHENTELMSGTWKCRRRALARSQTLEMSKNSYIFASISRVDNKIRRMRYFIARLIAQRCGLCTEARHFTGLFMGIFFDRSVTYPYDCAP